MKVPGMESTSDPNDPKSDPRKHCNLNRLAEILRTGHGSMRRLVKVVTPATPGLNGNKSQNLLFVKHSEILMSDLICWFALSKHEVSESRSIEDFAEQKQ